MNFGSIARPIIDLTTNKHGKDISQEWDSDPKYQEASLSTHKEIRSTIDKLRATGVSEEEIRALLRD
eukprot:COSAG02_NODE_4946_length_4801_cov_2.406423_3_plen_67_part_00